MKQDKNKFPDINLDALEREIAVAAQIKASSPDPLAELARIMGQDDPFAGFDKAASQARSSLPSGRSLDDILNAPPSTILRGDQREANFDFMLDQPALRASVAPQDAAVADIDEDIELPQLDEVSLAAEHAAEYPNEEDLFEDDPIAGLNGISDEELDAELERVHKTLPADALEVPEDLAVALPTATTSRSPQFDDMLAEFESAMRDVGGEKIASVSAPSLAPTVVPLPPEELLYASDTITNTGFSNSGLAGAAAAGAAVIAAGSMAAGSSARDQAYGSEEAPAPAKKTKRGLMIAFGVIGIAVIGISALFAFGSGTKKNIGAAAPVIAAKAGLTKERPANPGGVDVPNQDKEVLKAPAPAATAAERVVPREEQPVDLKQAQTNVATAPVVRQIPGVSPGAAAATAIVAAAIPPAAPASPALAGTQPVPRPVASVPITIAGTPPAPAVLAPPVVAAPVVVPVPPTVAAPVAPAAPAVSAARPAEPEAAAAPRRVRTVPIKTDSEAAPRPQARPVQSAPRVAAAPEPSTGNAPMQITPQALRGSQRVASAAPAETVETAATAPRPANNAGNGSGFTVQLGAEGSQESARAKFNKIKGDHSDVLGSQNANIRNAEVNGKSVYRIRVGNMSREQAVGMCERLKADGGSCFVARN
jgi:SPOR domain